MRGQLNLLLLGLLLWSAGGAVGARAQEGPEETVRVSHRVVFLDALVRDKRTSNLASDLKRENFEVYADGKPRQISYFNREGDDGRKPLALVLVLDLRSSGSGRFLRRTEILEAMMNELAKLPPQDEVAVLVLEAGGYNARRQWLTHFTRDHAQISTALSVVPSLVARGSCCGEASSSTTDEKNRPTKESPTETRKTAPETASDDSSAARKSEPGDAKKADDEIESETKFVGKNGDTVTRTVYKDGRVKTRKVLRNGDVNIEMEDEFELVSASLAVAELASKERPHSQAALIWVSDGLVPIFYVERDMTVAELTKANVIFSALVTDMKFGFKLFRPVLQPLGNIAGLNIYDSTKHVARETGGEALRVNRPADYASGLNKIIGNLTGRYSLGFTLTEAEQDDGQMHRLEVRARARDARGKERKLQVTARRGYFMPKENEAAQARD